MDTRIGRRWSRGEDSCLEELVERFGPDNWDRIANELNVSTRMDGSASSRTPIQCHNRWQQMEEGVTKGPWSQEEDDLILQCISLVGVERYTH